MTYEIKAVNDQVHVLARWDKTWNSYNNCYLVSGPGHCVMIDCGKAQHSSELLEALRELGRTPEDITHVLATHGHKDHVGAHTLFSGAVIHIHPGDRNLLSEELQRRSSFDAPDDGVLLDFACVRLGHHTPGSVAFFHRATRTLFAGDHLCFFGEALPADGLVSLGAELRERASTFVRDWSLNESDRAKYHFDEFLRGLQILAGFQSLAFCTGHGGVLTGGIPKFLRDLISVGKNA